MAEWTTVQSRKSRKRPNILVQGTSETSSTFGNEEPLQTGTNGLDQDLNHPASTAATTCVDLSPIIHRNAKYTSTAPRDIMKELDDRNLPYRAGWPRLPPLPLRTERRGADLWVQQPRAILLAVRAILQTHCVRWRRITFAYRAPYQLAEQQRGIDTHHTLLIIADLGGPSPKSAICDTRMLLLQQEATRFTFIEVIDYRAVQDLNTYPVDDKHMFMINRELIRDMVMHEVQKRGQSVTHIEFLRRGLFSFNKRMKCPCTVVVTTLTADQEVWWLEIMPSIKLRVRDIVRNVAVEVLQGVDNSNPT